MDPLAFEHHLTSPQGHGHVPAGAFTAQVGGGACCDTVGISLATDGQEITGAGFDAHGCGAATAAGSAAVTLVRGRSLLDAARVGPLEIAQELGGLSPGKLHAAEVAGEALARALGAAAAGRGALAAPSPGGRSRTLVAISGGVDSAVVAWLCARQGETVAVTLELWGDPENDAERSCCSASAVAQARALAHRLGLPHFTLDLRREFRAGVVEPFIAGYAAGETPNPCVGCNGHVRLDAMLELADRLGCAALATGHYARVWTGEEQGSGVAGGVDGLAHLPAQPLTAPPPAPRPSPAHPSTPQPVAPPLLRIAADPAKDQTYMLSALSPASLARMRFPLGELTKPEVRRIAAEAGLPVAHKPDSQDLCFLAGTSRARFLERHGKLGRRPGQVVDRHGNVLATHAGHELFTVGQRRGLGVVLRPDKPATPEPQYVLAKDAVRNRVVVGPREALLTQRVTVRGARLHRAGARVDRVKLRYRSRPLPARVLEQVPAGRHRTLTLALDEPVAGAAPGQLACLMEGELIVGWAVIASPAAG